MQEIVAGIFHESWRIFLVSSPYMLLGFLAAGLIKAFMPDQLITRHLGERSKTSVLKASLVGIPLPLCSCAVVPTAMGLHKQGASKGSTTAFLISTPETGVDSIAVTYALLDPLMTVFRPVSAFITATVAGLLTNLMPDKQSGTNPSGSSLETQSRPTCSCNQDCGEDNSQISDPEPVHRKMISGLSYAINRLLSDIGPWFLLGVLIAGLITFFVPRDFIEQQLGAGILPMLLVLLLATPLYVCATASTPIVAALALKGLSPGAALVFLLAGPATNLVTLTILARLLGIKTTLVYLGSIVFCALGLGLAVDWIYLAAGLDVADWAARTVEEETGWGYLGSAILLLGLIVYSLRNRLGLE